MNLPLAQMGWPARQSCSWEGDSIGLRRRCLRTRTCRDEVLQNVQRRRRLGRLLEVALVRLSPN